MSTVIKKDLEIEDALVFFENKELVNNYLVTMKKFINDQEFVNKKLIELFEIRPEPVRFLAYAMVFQEGDKFDEDLEEKLNSSSKISVSQIKELKSFIKENLLLRANFVEFAEKEILDVENIWEYVSSSVKYDITDESWLLDFKIYTAKGFLFNMKGEPSDILGNLNPFLKLYLDHFKEILDSKIPVNKEELEDIDTEIKDLEKTIEKLMEISNQLKETKE